jgi:hypothetical protein
MVERVDEANFMKANVLRMIILGSFLGFGMVQGTSGALNQVYTLKESFQEGASYHVESSVRLQGRLSLPAQAQKESQDIQFRGEGRIRYTERVLTPLEDGEAIRTVRLYQQVEMQRRVGEATQETTVRPHVRRLVLLAHRGKRAPFSPDGPLTWGELDLIRTDPFCPILMTGLLPQKAVAVGDKWKVTAAAVRELTDLDTIQEGGLEVELIGPTQVQQKQLLRLKLSGVVRGSNGDGQHVHHLDGTIYYDPQWPGITYLSLKGTHHLLNEKGQPGGTIEGYFVLNRSAAHELPPKLQDSALSGLNLKPTPENTRLLFEDHQSGLRFLYPRSWRVGMVRGRQITIDHVQGAGILLTLESSTKMPTPEGYYQEVVAFLRQRQAQWQKLHGPHSGGTPPNTLIRFGIRAKWDKGEEQLEYALVYQPEGGVIAAARLPLNQVETLLPEMEQIFRSLQVTRHIP